MKYYKILVFAFSISAFSAWSAEIKKDTIPEKPARPAFESSYLINNPTNVLFAKKTLEIQIKHRFGLVNSGENDLVGIWAPSNIRLGVSYAVGERWTLGFGTTKFDRLQDFSLKIALFRQTRSNKVPFSASYFGNFTIDARKKNDLKFDQDRFSFFHQIIFARRFSPDLSLLVAPSLSHYNVVESTMNNDLFAIAIGGRCKISPQTAVTLEYNHPFPGNKEENSSDFEPKPGFSMGVEFSTSGHAFQLFVTNYNALVPQKDMVFNQNDFFSGDFLIGFNITRSYRF
jgi:hypothetical protein